VEGSLVGDFRIENRNRNYSLAVEQFIELFNS
jgi:hypothetical protein